MPIDYQATAPVFQIQSYCIHDGPGIRDVVFLKGCPLRCLWCANPESQHAAPELLYDPGRCTACGACAAVCPQGIDIPAVFAAYTGLLGGGSEKDARAAYEKAAAGKGKASDCIGCGQCEGACPQHLPITDHLKRAAEMFPAE